MTAGENITSSAGDANKLPEAILKRTPIVLGAHTVAVITLFHMPHDHLSDLWLLDYVDHIKEVDHAAGQFLKQLEDHWSPAFLMALRDKITAELTKHDSAYGTAFATTAARKVSA